MIKRMTTTITCKKNLLYAMGEKEGTFFTLDSHNCCNSLWNILRILITCVLILIIPLKWLSRRANMHKGQAHGAKI